MSNPSSSQHVVIIGAGFAGLYAAQALSEDQHFRITLIDKRNYHLFQPLLYQVATGMLSPGDIASPIRHILKDRPNVQVLQGAVTDIDPQQRRILFTGGEIDYDVLIVATGVKHSYFGHDEWRERAPGLKTVEHALEMRQRIFSAFEAAEVEPDPDRRNALMTFVVVGGGPTGVELAGALGELAQHTLQGEYRAIDSRHAHIILAEGAPKILSSYPKDLADAARRGLEKLGVEVRTRTLVQAVEEDRVQLKTEQGEIELKAGTILWAAGVQASRFGQILAKHTQAQQDRAGKLIVNADLSLPAHPEIFVVGDLAHYAHQGGKPLPGVAQTAIQQGRYVAALLKARRQGVTLPAFHYHDKGNLAVIGRNSAVAQIGAIHLKGIVAWYIWAVVHIMALIGFGNRLLVMTRWAWSYVTRQSGVRLITSIPEARTEQTDRAHHYSTRDNGR